MIGRLIKIPDQVPFDYMHLVLQGHAKWVYDKLFSSKNLDDSDVQEHRRLNKKETIDLINKILIETKLPHTFNRKGTNIKEASKWKSSEIKTFLFYLSIPIFLNFLPSRYFYEYASYVIAIRIL